jgi:choline dehydrogenase-like flavoprotein
MSPHTKPRRAEVCIIGGGASGATAAKVLTEAGAHVVMLERGPWRQAGDFSPDELANVNRYFLTPDPRLHPRTHRSFESEEARITRFSPTPYIVGGGTSHWTGWVPRMLEVDFEMRSRHGDIPGADLVDWPISYDDLEPFYDKVEWSLGVSGEAGANVHEAPRRRGYPLPPLPRTRYAKRFQDGCDEAGINSFLMPIAMRSAPFGGRPKTVQSAFVQTMGDPSGTRGGAAQTFIPDAVATGRLDLRPNCSVRELEVDRSGRITAAIYEDADGRTFAQEADVFVLACNAIESARLLLLSRSAAHPDGLGNHSGYVGRCLTLHEYTEAIGVFDGGEPLYPWAGGGYISAGTAEYYATDESRGFIGGGLIAAGSAGFPLPINWALPEKPAWGAEAKRIDQAYFNRSMSAGIVLQDLPQARNRVDLDPDVRDAWGLPVARVTHRAHENDLAMANWLVDRCGEILDAAGATKVWRNYISEITGNAVHQHGTLRMGDDPERSVVDPGCRAHSVPNLYVVDGSVFPTPSGVNPTLTIMANAWRVADGMVRARRAGAGSSGAHREVSGGTRSA